MTRMLARALAAPWVLAVVVTVGNAEVTPLDSSDFDWKYEMNLLPTEEDQDENEQPDFVLSDGTEGAGSSSVAGGIMTLNSPGSGSYFFLSTDAGTIWPGKYTATGGYTVEARVKAIRDDNWRGPFSVAASPSGTGDHGYLAVQSGGQSWGETAAAGNLGTNDNTDDFHVFRVAADNGLFQVWRDSIPVGENLPSAISYDLDRLYFGDTGGGNAGECQIDYIRFTAGAHSPVPEPTTLAMLIIGFLTLVASRRRFRE